MKWMVLIGKITTRTHGPRYSNLSVLEMMRFPRNCHSITVRKCQNKTLDNVHRNRYMNILNDSNLIADRGWETSVQYIRENDHFWLRKHQVWVHDVPSHELQDANVLEIPTKLFKKVKLFRMQNATFKAEKVVPASKLPNFLASIVLKMQLFQGKGTEPFYVFQMYTHCSTVIVFPTAFNLKKFFPEELEEFF